MGGKTSQATAQTTIPPEVLARYNSVNTQAQNVASTPFQQYSTDPNAFVAPMTSTQNAGVANVNAASGMAQPYFNQATGFALAGANAVNPSAIDAGTINQYQNPYLQQVLGSTSALINQNNQQQQMGQLGNAITSGAFGGDRSGLAAAALAGQQQLAAGQTYSGIASDAYTQALAAAQQQQGVNLAAQQANRAALQQTSESLAGLGTGAQGAALSGAQAQLGAGQVGQQTQQAGLTALYNQFLQQQSYPFQVAQFLANIAEGTGALSGSTTTQTTPGGLFMSDERLKEDMEPIGKGFDGANIYRFRYKGDPTTRIGFSAQETERRHPEAVHNVGGFRALDQHAATEEAAERGGFANAANDNDDDTGRRARQAGGYQGFGGVPYPGGVVPFDVAALLQAQEQMYGPYSQVGLYGGQASGAPHGGSSYVPAANLPVAHLQAPQVARPQGGGDPLHAAATAASDVKDIGTDVGDVGDWLKQQSWAHNDPMAGLYASGGFARAHRQYGGGGPDDISSTQDDDPYKPKGPGLDIPTEGSKVQPLQGPKVDSGGGGGGGMGGLLGAASDVAGIGADMTKILPAILPFFGVPFRRGGRAGFAGGGEPPPGQPLDIVNDLAPDDPMLANLLRVHPPHHVPPPEAAPDSPGPPSGGDGGPGAPPAGFAGAGPPSAPPEAAPSGFGGANLAGISPGFGGTLHAEGTGLNPASGAIGPGQFLKSTFLGEFKKVFPQRAATMSDAQIMALHGTPEGNQLQAQMIPHLRAENAAVLQRHGLPVNPVTEHVMWILGPGEGPKVLSADPSTPMENLVRPIAINENARIMKGKTAGDFVQWAGRSIGRARGGFAGARRGYQTDGLVVDPDAIDPSGGQDSDRRKLAAAPQVDPGIMQQAQLDDQVRAEAAKAAATPTPTAGAPASNVGANAAAGLADAAPSGFLPAAQNTAGAPDGSRGEADYLTPSEQRAQAAYLNTDRMTREQTGQGDRPLTGNILQRAGQWVTQPEHFMPLISAIAGTLAAPTKYPMVALSQGALAGANTYQQQRAYDLAQVQKDAELGMAQENIEGGVYGQRTGRIQAIGGLYSQGMQAFDNQWTPTNRVIAGPNGLEQQYLDPHGNPVPKSEYIRQRNAHMFDLVGSLGGSGNMSAPIRAMQDIVAPSGAQTAPPSGAQSNVLPPHPSVVPSNVPGSAGGAGTTGAGTLGAGTDTGATGVRPPTVAGGPSGQPGQSGQVAPAAAPATSKLPGRSAEERAARGDYMNSGNQVPTVDATGIRPDFNPYLLTTQSREEANSGLPGAAAQAQIDANKADEIFHGRQPAMTTNGTPDYRFAQVGPAQDKIAADAQMNLKRGQEVAAAAADWHNTAGQMGQAIHNLRDIYKDESPNLGSTEKAKMIGIWRTLFGDRATSAQAQAFQTAVEQGNKVAALQMIQTVQNGLTGAPKAGLDVSKMATPTPDMSPDTRYALVHNQQAMLDRETAYMNAVAKYHGRIQDWTRFDTEWANENPVEKYERQATFELGGYFAGMSDAGKKRFTYFPHTDAEYDSVPPDAPVVYKGRKGYK